MAQYTLTDGNSILSVGAISDLPVSERGLNSWVVDDVQQLKQEWFWYRIGEGAEMSIDTISAPVVTQYAPNYVNIQYVNNLVRLDLSLMLVGGEINSHTADIAETFRVTNVSGKSLDFHVFEYDDFNLSNTPNDDSATMLNSTSVFQWDPQHQVTVGAVPLPNHWEVAAAPTILNELTDASASNLADGVTALDNTDCSFAMQWDKTIAARSSFILSKDKLIEVGPVPEPSMIAGVLGAASLLAFRRRRA